MTEAEAGRIAAALADLPGRSRSGARAALHRVRGGFALALQAGAGAAISWYLAHDVFGRPAPFFAPIAAVITLASSVGQRLRRTTELVIGVAIGIGIGDSLIMLTGTGPVQLGLIVMLAILVATSVGGGTPLVVQAASSAVLVATLTANAGAPWARFLDALVGGGVGLAVMTILLPLNPLSVVRRAADPALTALSGGLHRIASALVEGDRDAVAEVLAKLRAAEPTFAGFSSAIVAARENVAFAPARWHTRGALAQYVEGADQVAYALRNVRVLTRRVASAMADGERVPDMLPAAVALLGDAVDLLRQDWARGVEPVAARERALRAVAGSARAYAEGLGFSGGVVVAQIRSTALDLLRATGVDYVEAIRLVRRAAGHERARPGRRAAGRGRPGHGGAQPT